MQIAAEFLGVATMSFPVDSFHLVLKFFLSLWRCPQSLGKERVMVM